MALIDAGPVATTAVWVTVAVWFVGERALTIRDLARHVWRRGRQDAGSTYWVVAGVAGGLLCALGFAARSVLRLPHPTLLVAAGLVVMWAGILLRGWSVVMLGRSFTTMVVVTSDQPVVSRGPYRVVRHRQYLGMSGRRLQFRQRPRGPRAVPAAAGRGAGP